MEGSNSYLCSQCCAYQQGSRITRLRRAPRVLNLHLLRFVYERETMRKKKISSALQVPATLDMTSFTAPAPASLTTVGTGPCPVTPCAGPATPCASPFPGTQFDYDVAGYAQPDSSYGISDFFHTASATSPPGSPTKLGSTAVFFLSFSFFNTNTFFLHHRYVLSFSFIIPSIHVF